MHVIAAKAVAFAEALRPDFKVYARNVVENAKALAESLRGHGLDIVSGGTDNHLMLVDLRPKGLKGNVSEKALVRAAITCNKNGIPYDPEKPFVTSGLRLGTPAATTRGFGVAEFKQVGGTVAIVLRKLGVIAVHVVAADGKDAVSCSRSPWRALHCGLRDRSRPMRTGTCGLAVSQWAVTRYALRAVTRSRPPSRRSRWDEDKKRPRCSASRRHFVNVLVAGGEGDDADPIARAHVT